MSRLAIALALALAASACGGGNNGAASPTSPSVQSAPRSTFTVSGMVVGQAGVPLEGAPVQVASQQGVTDSNGYYSLSAVPSSYGAASAIKVGYAAGLKL